MMQIREQGWECPRCQRVWAPRINACGWCNHDAKRDPIPRHIETYRPEHFNPIWNYAGDDSGWMD